MSLGQPPAATIDEKLKIKNENFRKLWQQSHCISQNNFRTISISNDTMIIPIWAGRSRISNLKCFIRVITDTKPLHPDMIKWGWGFYFKESLASQCPQAGGETCHLEIYLVMVTNSDPGLAASPCHRWTRTGLVGTYSSVGTEGGTVCLSPWWWRLWRCNNDRAHVIL